MRPVPVAPKLAPFAASLLLANATAPFQCTSEPDPSRAIEEDPGQVLYDLAERFRTKGDTKAREETLRFLIAKYPSNRFAKMAQQDLAEMGILDAGIGGRSQ